MAGLCDLSSNNSMRVCVSQLPTVRSYTAPDSSFKAVIKIHNYLWDNLFTSVFPTNFFEGGCYACFAQHHVSIS